MLSGMNSTDTSPQCLSREMPFGLSCIAFQKEKTVVPVHTNYYYLHYTFLFFYSVTP